MSSTLVEVDGNDTSGTTEFIFYKDGSNYIPLGSASNITAAAAASTNPGLLFSYADLVNLPSGDDPANIRVFNQAGTISDTWSRSHSQW